MSNVRRIELTLAGLIAGGAAFTALVPGAHSDTQSIDYLSQMRPSVSLSDFEDMQISSATRNLTRSVLDRQMRVEMATPTFQSTDGQSAELSFQTRDQRGDASQDDVVGSGLGFTVRAKAPEGSEISKWSIVGGAGRETFAITPTGRREMVLVPVAVESTVGDAHLGVGYEINDSAYATLGYVREDRHFDFGTKDYEEEEHFVGFSLHARW